MDSQTTREVERFLDMLRDLRLHQPASVLKHNALGIRKFGEAAVEPVVSAWLADDSPENLGGCGAALIALGDMAVDAIIDAARTHKGLHYINGVNILRAIDTQRSREALRDILLMDVRYDRVNKQRFRRNLALCLSLVYIAVPTLWVIAVATGAFSFPITLMLLSLILCNLAGKYLGPQQDEYLQVRRICVLALQSVRDCRITAAFALCLNDSSPDIRSAVRRYLVANLPRVKASDRVYFRAEVLAQLTQVLDSCGVSAWRIIKEEFGMSSVYWFIKRTYIRLRERDVQLHCAILKALEQVGDEHALKRVEELARAAKQPEIRRAAQQCLPALRASASTAQQANTLLRPAEPTQATTLLRPASATQGDEQLLLHVSSAADEDAGDG